MNTPVVDFVRRYAQQRTTRMHMPGHKGRGPLGCEELDITEIAGADELYEAEGIIAQSEANATQLFGTAQDSSIIPEIFTYPPKGTQPIPYSVSLFFGLNLNKENHGSKNM